MVTTMKNKKMFGTMEYIFDISYLSIILGFAFYYLIIASTPTSLLFGITALVLGLGDSFHLIPRILSITKDNTTKYQVALGIGKMITSISMTIVYLLLWQIILNTNILVDTKIWSMIIYLLAFIRIIACILPHNKWTTNNSSDTWNIIRNIPFFMIGIIVTIGFFLIKDTSTFSYMYLAITLSFAFYIPVVLYSKTNPKIGMLMLPKSCMYIWIIAMGIL